MECGEKTFGKCFVISCLSRLIQTSTESWRQSCLRICWAWEDEVERVQYEMCAVLPNNSTHASTCAYRKMRAPKPQLLLLFRGQLFSVSLQTAQSNNTFLEPSWEIFAVLIPLFSTCSQAPFSCFHFVARGLSELNTWRLGYSLIILEYVVVKILRCESKSSTSSFFIFVSILFLCKYRSGS